MIAAVETTPACCHDLNAPTGSRFYRCDRCPVRGALRLLMEQAPAPAPKQRPHQPWRDGDKIKGKRVRE